MRRVMHANVHTTTEKKGISHLPSKSTTKATGSQAKAHRIMKCLDGSIRTSNLLVLKLDDE